LIYPDTAKDRVHSHIRNLSGIIDTIYGTTSELPHYQPHEIGRHASYYLQAHGYGMDSINLIALIWAKNDTVDKFVDAIGAFGMAATEIRWLWDLIQHDDDCTA
jgi:hypothetical protein